MAKTTAPLLSFGGTGSVAKTMTFSHWRGVPYVRRYTVPSNPNTAKQKHIRGIFQTLGQIWLYLSGTARAPWEAAAAGRPLLGRNIFTGNNVRFLNNPESPPATMEAFQASPGAAGGLPPAGMVLTADTESIDVALTLPTVPSGWTLESAVAVAFPDQAPDVPLEGAITVVEETGTPDDFSITGLIPSEQYVVSVFLVWTKADGKPAYSVSLTDTATPTA